ncbi:MAG: fatty acid desaturase [Deltaproteobacteria bacterium]|nr:fatty acid desaturase [Deltaproteobacteria bacterium]
MKKFATYVAFHFVLFPALAGARWKEVLAAAFAATIVRNFIFVALQTGSSVGHDVSTRHPRAYGRKRPGEWLRFQVETSKNFQLSPLWETLCGGLDRHIEHHLFPSLPARRLHMLAPRVRALCEKNGLRYEHHHSIWASLSDSVRYLGSLSSRPQGDHR